VACRCNESYLVLETEIHAESLSVSFGVLGVKLNMSRLRRRELKSALMMG
jgi:hypothetical protein